MEKICDINQLDLLILPYLKKGVITNNFISLAEYKLYLEEKSLYYEKNNNVLMLFREVNGIYHTYFYINAFEEIKMPQNVVVEVVNPSDELVEYFLKLGIKAVNSRLEMERKSVNREMECNLLVKPSSEEIREAYDIVLSNFDNVCGYIPSQSEFLRDGILIYKDESGKIEGIVHYKTAPKCSQILHIAVIKEKRLCGIGRKILNGYIYLEKDKCKAFKLWVNEENENAIRFYERNGYAFSGRKSAIFSDIGDV